MRHNYLQNRGKTLRKGCFFVAFIQFLTSFQGFSPTQTRAEKGLTVSEEKFTMRTCGVKFHNFESKWSKIASKTGKSIRNSFFAKQKTGPEILIRQGLEGSHSPISIILPPGSVSRWISWSICFVTLYYKEMIREMQDK